jgi:arylsulfatase A-like enzyme
MDVARRTGLFLSLALGLASTAGARAADKPNFLFVYTDDQRWDALGVVQREHGDKGRFPWIKTPNMDRLADEGVRFRNMFVVNSLCSPSRASFLTGCYGHVNGIVNNHTQFNDKNVTYAGLLRAAGYRTGFVGKFHMDSQTGQRPGFDFSASFIGQGRYFDCPIEVNGKAAPSKGYVDDVCTDYAIQFIKDNKDKPFLIAVGLKACHGPFEPPERRKDDYAGELARSVPNLNIPAIYKEDAKKKEDAPEKVPVNLNYFRCIAGADDNLGRLLKTLDDLKLADDTVVVFCSDNGYYLGEHGLGDKRSAYEESMRIPLIVRYPKLRKKGKTLDQLALNVDIAPTLLDLAGVPVPKEMQGRSWRPLLEGKDADWRKAFFYCYFYESNAGTPTATAVRTDKAKLVKYPGHDKWTELFDLARDPYETKNLIDDPGARDLRRELEAEYERQAKAVDFRIPDFADDPKNDEPKAALKAWVLDYRFDKDDGDKVVDASGKDNHGAAKGAPLAEGRKDARARRFDGKGYIEVPKSPSLNPAVAGWTVEATFKADKPDGVVLARGGAANGYCLHLQEGRPVFTVVSGNQASRVEAKQSVAGEWAQVTARITTGKELVLTVNGKEAARGKLHAFIRRDPNDVMQIGADLGSRVVQGKELPHFVGLIESVRLYSGEGP